jgi:hypothetical protein
MSHVFNFVVEILLILKYNILSAEQIVKDSLFYVLWVVGVEVQVRISMSRFPAHFRGQF